MKHDSKLVLNVTIGTDLNNLESNSIYKLHISPLQQLTLLRFCVVLTTNVSIYLP